jgi:capsular polysaccharide biosynthesis protein
VGSSPLKTVGDALRRRHWLVWGMAIVAAVMALGAAHVRHPTYEATAVLSVDESQALDQGFDVAMQADQYATQRFIAMATEPPVLQAVCSREGRGCTPQILQRQVKASALRTTGLIGISADAPTPEDASRLANEVAQAVIQRNQQMINAQLQPQIAYYQGQLQQINQQIAQVQQAIAQVELIGYSDSGTANREAPLLAQLDRLQNQYTSTYSSLQQAQVQLSRQLNVLTLDQPAVLPTKPVDPNPKLYLAVGVSGGLLVGFLMALLAERLRDRIGDAGELAGATGCRLVLNLGEGGRLVGPASYGILAHASVIGRRERSSVLLVAASPGDEVDQVGIDLGQAVAEVRNRVLVVQSSSEPASRRQIPVGSTSEVVVTREEVPQPDGFDLTIRCLPPPLHGPATPWLEAPASTAVIVATKGRTRFSEARRTGDLLRQVGIEPVAAVLLPGKPAQRAIPSPGLLSDGVTRGDETAKGAQGELGASRERVAGEAVSSEG